MPVTLTPLRRERETTEAGGDASGSRVVTAVARAAWVQAVLRVTAAASNLSFAHTRVAVLGSGPLADELATRSAAMGARVVVAGDDPVALVELSQRGLPVSSLEDAPLGDVVIAFATGETTEPVTADLLGAGGTLLLVDAAEHDAAVDAATDPSSGRPGIDRIVGTDREVFLLAAREVADGSARRTRESLGARYLAALAEATAADPEAPSAELHLRADRALATELLA